MSIEKAAYLFQTDSLPVSCETFGHGHINSTFLLTTQSGRQYILQRVNHYVFKNPMEVVANAQAVTSFIQKKGQLALSYVPANNGAFCARDEDGNYWRMYDFVEGFCMDAPQCPEDFYQSALAFGKFQDLLSDFPAETLAETIPDFHNTPVRYAQLKQAIAENKAGRLAAVQKEVDFYLAQEEKGSLLQQMLERGELPLRVTHNDTKFNNVLLSNDTHKPLCVLDLDTVMPGLSLYDFGDAIRSGAHTGREDEQDLSKVRLQLDLFEMYVKGYLEAAPSLTDREVACMVLGAFTMTLECGSRFLADHLNGDLYFRTAYPEHNLVRCRTHIALVQQILNNWDKMEAIVQTAAAQVRK